MKKLILLFCFLFLCSCVPYIQGGVSYHSAKLDEPEIDLSAFLGHVELGIALDHNIDIYGRHTSGLTKIETGGGLNEVGVYKRLNF